MILIQYHVWTGKEDIHAITRTARSASLKIQSVIAAICLGDEGDSIEKTQALALMDERSSTSTMESSTSVDSLASSTWNEIPGLLSYPQVPSYCHKPSLTTSRRRTKAVNGEPQQNPAPASKSFSQMIIVLCHHVLP